MTVHKRPPSYREMSVLKSTGIISLKQSHHRRGNSLLFCGVVRASYFVTLRPAEAVYKLAAAVSVSLSVCLCTVLSI